MLFILLFVGISTSTANECTSCNVAEFTALSNLFTGYNGIYELKAFNESVFNNLEDVNDVIKNENNIDMMVNRDGLFVAISQILVKHGLNDIIGASILHNHFYLDSTEVMMLNTSSSDGIKFDAVPVSKQQYNRSHLVPYMFKFESPQSNQFNVYPLHYIYDASGEMQVKYDLVFSHKETLLEIGSALSQFEMIDNVGIFIDYFDGPDQLNEITDLKTRNQRFKVVAGDEQSRAPLITAYTFKDASCIQSFVGCEISCHRETICSVYCYTDNDNIHRQGHDDQEVHRGYHD